MTYVFPMMLAGLVVAGVPVLLHLIMRQKPKRLRFPAFRFLVQRHRRNQRKLQLRHLLLLAMRVLLIAGICFALALPHIGVNRRGRPLAAVFVFDTSYSMGYKNSEEQSRLDQAIKRALEMLDDPELPADSQVAVLDTAFGGAEFTANLNKARDDIRKLRLRPDNVSVTKSLQKAFALLDGVAKKNDEWSQKAMRFVAVFSDRTKTAWDANSLNELHQTMDYLSPDWQGVRQARDAIPTLITQLNTLREKLPPPDGVDYAEQSLLASLEKLKDHLNDVSANDIPLRSDIAATLADVRRQGRTLWQTLHALPKSAKDKTAYNEIATSLQTTLNHLRGFQAAFIDVGVENPIDLALLSLELPRGRQSFAADETIIFRANLRATGKTFQSAIMFQHENKTYRKPITLPEGRDDSILFELNGKQLQLVPGTYQVKVQSLMRDRLSFNNTLYATIGIRKPKQILILADEPEAAEDFSWALEAVTLSRLFQFRPQVRPVAEFPAKLTPEEFAKYDAVYLFQVAKPSLKLWEALDQYVAKGGSLGIVPPGNELDAKAYENDVAKKFLPGKFEKLIVHPDAKKKKVDFSDAFVGAIWDLEKNLIANHPLLKRFDQWREVNVDLVKQPRGALRYWHVEPVKGKSMVLVRYADDKRRPALLERIQTEGRGKVVQFTLPLDLRSPPWHNYLEKLNSFYLVLVSLTTNYLAGDDDDAKLNFITGKTEPVVALPSDKQYSTYTLRGPDLFPISIKPGTKWKTLPMAVEPFNYTLEGFAQPGVKGEALARFSVNMPPEESDLTRIEPTHIEWVLGSDTVVRAEHGKLETGAMQGFYSDSVELFPWIMIAILLLLALENMLANLFYGKKKKA